MASQRVRVSSFFLFFFFKKIPREKTRGEEGGW